MIKKFLLVSCILLGYQLSGQTAISGYIDTKDNHLSERKVYLTKIALEHFPDFENTIPIASSTINEEGFFEFGRNLIDEKEAVYRLYTNRFEKALNDTLAGDKLFLFSMNDTVFFKKSNSPFSEYSTTNNADREWKRMRHYEAKLKKLEPTKGDSLSDAYINSLKSYTKDSLQILIVKLIGIKQLDNQDLLDKDILKNKAYYIGLLTELKKSDIERSEYLFLENKLAFYTTELTENKYQRSILIILFLFLAVIGLLVVVLKMRSKESRSFFNEGDLSKQERNIRSLILEGKSNKEIANELFISLSTVKSHISNIYNKLRVSDRRELLQKYRN
ncbi:MAG: LuxR C-terminal-related transcriptional regulator [Flavobacteriaceae bacterium]